MIHSRDHEAEELSDNRKALRKSIRDRRIALQVSGPEPKGARRAGYESQHYYISTHDDPGFGISPKHNGTILPNGHRTIRGFFALDKNENYESTPNPSDRPTREFTIPDEFDADFDTPEIVFIPPRGFEKRRISPEHQEGRHNQIEAHRKVCRNLANVSIEDTATAVILITQEGHVLTPELHMYAPKLKYHNFRYEMRVAIWNGTETIIPVAMR
ncbi:Protein of unknown function [Pyronema omphalodes CBS 100304]|uniref:Uncharacterized protein n=1 Tax=Pyronema omphalodes (strain CBS 100304) TaxID=1076935 RepID=U4L4L4_PYROM|nr:Protein of unknown function [Pyronema omphalodes CBS 100304]